MDMKKLMSTTDSWGLLGLRLVTGAVFIAHGLPKFGFGTGGLGGTAEWLGSIGIPLPMVAAFLLAATEVVGGAMLIIGFMTRLAAAAQVFAMLIAVFLVHFANGFAGKGGYQWALLLAACAFALMIEGAGRYSADRKMSGNG